MAYMKQLFKEADTDNSGFLSIDELYNLLNLRLEVEIRREELEQLVGANDTDDDQQINIEEFINMMS